jgi:hypothetical protein
VLNGCVPRYVAIAVKAKNTPDNISDQDEEFLLKQLTHWFN